MAEVNPRLRRGLWVLAVTLTLAGAIMAYLMTSLLRAAAVEPQGPRQDALTRLAWVCLSMLSLDFVLLVWAGWRIIAIRLQPDRHGPTPYVDAWAIAGERVRTGENRILDVTDEDEEKAVEPDVDDEEDDEDSDPDDDTGNGRGKT